MNNQGATTVEANEIARFADYYKNKPYNPTGWRLRLNREIHSLQRASGMKHFNRVLSIGCGNGEFELLLAPFAQYITGFDISPEAIENAGRNAAKANITNVDFKCLSASEYDWQGQFDVIICLAFLHHTQESELPGLLRRAYTHLKQGGFFYSHDPSTNGILRRIGRKVLGTRVNKYRTPDEHDLNPQETASMLRMAGFDSISIGYIDFILIPAAYILSNGPLWPLYLCSGIDRLWCHGPCARWANAFTVIARKKR